MKSYELSLEWLLSRADRTETCWLWQGHLTPQGYGAFKHKGRFIQAHRYALEQVMSKPIPPGFFALHTCDVPACIRNDDSGVYEVNGVVFPRWGHLWLGTKRDNNADRIAKGRSSKGDSHWTRTRPDDVLRGECHGRAKLTTTQVEDIRTRRKNGELLRILADEFEMSISAIAFISQGRSWR